ncbi:hypothetical protein M5C90_08965 [Pseudomonas chlororaphis subsp. piscium]|nr:hypothetical protein M5C90_08965 [Pseudomonas chlororaphis subsp. piscium]
MFPGNFEVLKIPARSMLLSAKSSISAMASTSATLAAREGYGEGLTVSEGIFGQLSRGRVLIFFPACGALKNRTEPVGASLLAMTVSSSRQL